LHVPADWMWIENSLDFMVEMKRDLMSRWCNLLLFILVELTLMQFAMRWNWVKKLSFSFMLRNVELKWEMYEYVLNGLRFWMNLNFLSLNE